MKITVRRGRKKTRTFTVSNLGRVVDLQRKIHSWFEVAPGDQCLFYNGILLHPVLGLDSLGVGITITMAKGMLGGPEQAPSAGERRRREGGRSLPSVRRGNAKPMQQQIASTRRQSG